MSDDGITITIVGSESGVSENITFYRRSDQTEFHEIEKNGKSEFHGHSVRLKDLEAVAGIKGSKFDQDKVTVVVKEEVRSTLTESGKLIQRKGISLRLSYEDFVVFDHLRGSGVLHNQAVRLMVARKKKINSNAESNKLNNE